MNTAPRGSCTRPSYPRRCPNPHLRLVPPGRWLTSRATTTATGRSRARPSGKNRRRARFLTSQEVTGYLGRGLVNTYREGDKARGTLTSPPFTVDRTYLNFLLGGGAQPDRTGLELLVDGKVVRSATGKNEEQLTWRTLGTWRI